MTHIIKTEQDNKSIRTALIPLVINGTVVLSRHKLRKDHIIPKEVSGKLVSEIVIEDR